MFVAHLVPSDAVYSSTEALTSRFQNKKPAAEVVAVSKLTAEQWQTMWQHRLDAMASGKKTSGRAGAGAEQDERLATLQWMQDVNHALRPVDWSFSQIRRSEPVSKTDEDMETRPHADAPILIVCTDQEALQLAAVSYLRNKKGVFVEHVPDPAHRSHNDSSLALAAAGLMKFAVWSVSLYNLRFGPWRKGAWSRRVQETAEHIAANMTPSDPVLMHFFPEILADADLSPDMNTAEQREAWLRDLPNMTCVRTKGPKASLSRFNSLTTSHNALDKEWSALAFVLVVLCLESGWFQTLADLHKQDKATTVSADQLAATRSAARVGAKAEMQDDRRSKKNTLHSMTKFICSPDNKHTARLLFHVLQPEELRCSRMLQQLRSPEDTCRIYSEWAHWSWMETAHQIVVRWSDLQGLSRIGFDVDLLRSQPPSEEEMLWQDALAGNMVNLAHQVLRFRAGAQLFYTNGFGASAGLLHCDAGRAATSLRYLQNCRDTAAAVHASGSLHARKLLADHCSQGPVMKYILEELTKTSFQEVPDDLRATLLGMWSGLLNTKIIEDCNKIQREAEQRNSTSKDLGRLAGWQAISTAGLLQNYRRTEVKTSTLYHVPTEFDVGRLFQKSRCRTLKAEERRSDKTVVDVDAAALDSANVELLQGVTKKRDWASHTHAEEQEVLAAFSVLQKCHRLSDDWSLCERVWMSGLLPEGHAVLVGEPPVPLYVVRSYRLAALCWPAEVGVQGERRVVLLKADAASMYWYHAETIDVEVLHLRAASPLRALHYFMPGSHFADVPKPSFHLLSILHLAHIG